MVRIITDSTSDIPQEEAVRLGVTVVPLTVLFGSEAYRDGIDLTAGEFYEKLPPLKRCRQRLRCRPANSRRFSSGLSTRATRSFGLYHLLENVRDLPIGRGGRELGEPGEDSCH
jgi:hypothetical protein